MSSIITSGKHKDYVDALCLMTGLSIETVLEFAPKETMDTFKEGLIINKIIDLAEFCSKVIYNDRHNQ